MSQKLTESGPRVPPSEAREPFSAGEVIDFKALHQECNPWLLRLAFNLCRDRNDAEDLVAEVWLRVLIQFSAPGRSISPSYLVTSLTNLFFNQVRKRKGLSRASESPELLFFTMGHGPEQAYGELGEELLRRVEQLPSADRQLLLEDRRTSPGAWTVSADMANRLRVRRHRLRRRLMQALLLLEAREEAHGAPAASPPSSQVSQQGVDPLGVPAREASDAA